MKLQKTAMVRPKNPPRVLEEAKTSKKASGTTKMSKGHFQMAFRLLLGPPWVAEMSLGWHPQVPKTTGWKAEIVDIPMVFHRFSRGCAVRGPF